MGDGPGEEDEGDGPDDEDGGVCDEGEARGEAVTAMDDCGEGEVEEGEEGGYYQLWLLVWS